MGNGTKKDEIDRREAEQITREEFEALFLPPAPEPVMEAKA